MPFLQSSIWLWSIFIHMLQNKLIMQLQFNCTWHPTSGHKYTLTKCFIMYVSGTKCSICIFRVSGLHFTILPICDVDAVICGKTAVTWFAASTNQRRSALSIPHFTFRIPHFTHSPWPQSATCTHHIWPLPVQPLQLLNTHCFTI